MKSTKSPAPKSTKLSHHSTQQVGTSSVSYFPPRTARSTLRTRVNEMRISETISSVQIACARLELGCRYTLRLHMSIAQARRRDSCHGFWAGAPSRTAVPSTRMLTFLACCVAGPPPRRLGRLR